MTQYVKYIILSLFAIGSVLGQFASFSEPETVDSDKSLVKAAVMSAVLPGTGERYLRHGSSYVFWTTETATWLTYIGFGIKQNMLEDEYKALASRYAGVDPKNKNDRFFTDVGSYDSRYEYNYFEHLFGRENARLYPETAEYFWQWDSDESRSEYYDIRKQREQLRSNMKIVLSVAAINRLASVINVLRIGSGKPADFGGFSFNADARQAGINNDHLSIRFSLSKEF